MPTYEYRCDSCGTVVEAVQGFHDAPLTQCPSCDGTLKKRFGNVGVVFKGSGFYRNDARAERKSGGSKTDAKSKTEPAPAGSSAEKAEKSAEKAEKKAAPAKDAGSSSTSSGKSSSTT